MGVKTHDSDILAHINGPDTLAGQAVANGACISLLDVLKVCANIQGNNVDITLYLASVEIASGVINTKNPSITLGGGAMGFKAEVTITLETSPLAIKICGKVCAPIVGCKSGCTTLHL